MNKMIANLTLTDLIPQKSQTSPVSIHCDEILDKQKTHTGLEYQWSVCT